MIEIATLIPQYSKLHRLLLRLSKTAALTFEEQQFVCDFYSNFSDLEAIEKMLILLVSIDATNNQILIKSLQTEVQNCIKILTNYPFSQIDTQKVCTIFSMQYDNQISHQLVATTALFKQLNRINGSLDAIGFREHSESEEQKLWDNHDVISKKYNAEKQILNDLYEKQKEVMQLACKYQKNHFPFVLSLSENIMELLAKYVEKDNEQTAMPLFPMELIASLYTLCNEQQFETLSAIDFYTALNTPTSSISLQVKKGEQTRVCYIIYKLYDSLSSPNKTDWRNEILEALDIKESFYQSKYKEAGQSSSSDKSFEFARQLNKLFA